MQALYLAQVCSLRTDISLCGTRLHESQHRLLVVLGSWQGCAAAVVTARLRSAPASSSGRVTSTGQTSALYLRDRLSNPVSRPAQRRERRECVPHDYVAVRMCACHGFEQGTYREALLQNLSGCRVQYSVSLGPRFTSVSVRSTTPATDRSGTNSDGHNP
jgi:hypothetical protein